MSNANAIEASPVQPLDHLLDCTAIGVGLPLAFITATDVFQGMAATGALLAGIVQALRYWRECKDKQAPK